MLVETFVPSLFEHTSLPTANVFERGRHLPPQLLGILATEFIMYVGFSNIFIIVCAVFDRQTSLRPDGLKIRFENRTWPVCRCGGEGIKIA